MKELEQEEIKRITKTAKKTAVAIVIIFFLIVAFVKLYNYYNHG
jgi:hypothetical protein